MISEYCKLVIRIISRFLQMGQMKTQMLVLQLYQTTIVIYSENSGFIVTLLKQQNSLRHLYLHKGTSLA